MPPAEKFTHDHKQIIQKPKRSKIWNMVCSFHQISLYKLKDYKTDARFGSWRMKKIKRGGVTFAFRIQMLRPGFKHKVYGAKCNLR